ncbi:MAG: hypothetical protein WC988_02710 [Patescibacteria group bacterium]
MKKLCCVLLLLIFGFNLTTKPAGAETNDKIPEFLMYPQAKQINIDESVLEGKDIAFPLEKLTGLLTTDSIPTVVSWYKSKLENNGYTLVSQDNKFYDWTNQKELELPEALHEMQKGVSLVYAKAGHNITVDIYYYTIATAWVIDEDEEGLCEEWRDKLSSWFKVQFEVYRVGDKCIIGIFSKVFISVISEPIEGCPLDKSGLTSDSFGNECGKNETCSYPPDVETKRQEILTRLNSKYKFKVIDSQMCGKQTCGNNSLWSAEQLAEIEKVIDSLPACFLDKLMLEAIQGRPDGGVYAQVYEKTCCDPSSKLYAGYLFLDKKITFCGQSYAAGGYSAAAVLYHELTHAYQWGGAQTIKLNPNAPYANPTVISWLTETGWNPDGTCLPVIGCAGVHLSLPPDLPTDYARRTRNPLEDMAESVRLYTTSSRELMSISPRRFNFVKNNILCGKEF